MAAISEKGATLQPKGNSSEDVIVKNSLYKADKVASKLSFNRKEMEQLWIHINFIMMSQNTVEKLTIIP